MVSEAVETAKKAGMSLEDLIEGFRLGGDNTCGRCAIYKQEIARIVAIELNKTLTDRFDDRVKRPAASERRASPVNPRRWPWQPSP